MSDLRNRLSELSPEQRLLLARRLKEKRRAETASLTIPRRQDSGPVPLSFSQQRLWFLDQLDPGNSAYNVYRAARLTGRLDHGALRQSFTEIVRRHSILRTTFPIIGTEPCQLVAQPASFPLPETDLSGLPSADREAKVLRLATQEAYRAFRLDKEFSLRAQLLRLGETEHVLLVTAHHIAVDGWSVAILFSELVALYEAYVLGKPSPLPPPPIDYADYACWHRQWLRGPVYEAQIAYWRKQLAGAPAVLNLPTDRPRPAKLSYRGARHFFHMPKTLLEAVEALGRREGATLYMTLAVAFQALLALYSGQDEIVVGTPIAGRNLPELEGLIGCFSNTLVLRTSFAGNPTFRELLLRIKEVALGAFAHAETPFEKLVEELKPQRVSNRMLLFQVNFRVLTGPLPPLNFPGLALQFLEIDNRMAKFDLAAELRAKPDGLGGYIEYFTELFDESSIANLCADFETLLNTLVARPDTPFRSLNFTLRFKSNMPMNTTPSSDAKPKSLRDFRRKTTESAASGGENELNAATESPAGNPPAQATPLYKLRPARMKDCEFLYQLRKHTLQVYVSQFPGWSDEKREAYYLDFDPSIHEIIEVNGQVAGAVSIVKSATEIRYVNLHLMPEFQGLGIGTAIFKDSMAEADAKGIPVVFQGVLKTNPALKLYRRLGFEVVEEHDLRYVMKRPVPGKPDSPHDGSTIAGASSHPGNPSSPSKSLRDIKRKAVGLS